MVQTWFELEPNQPEPVQGGSVQVRFRFSKIWMVQVQVQGKMARTEPELNFANTTQHRVDVYAGGGEELS